MMTTPQVDSPSLPLSTSANVILDTLPPLKESRLSKLISSLSPADRTPFLYQDHYDRDPPPPDVAIRATFLPLVNLLVSPISWIFGFVESALLLIVYCVHKLLSWMTTIFVCIIKGLIYGFIGNVIKTLLATLDASILELMPSWMPYILVSNLASCTGLSALRSFWYSENYLQSLKWIFIFRGAMWLGLELIKRAYELWSAWYLTIEVKNVLRLSSLTVSASWTAVWRVPCDSHPSIYVSSSTTQTVASVSACVSRSVTGAVHTTCGVTW